MDFIKKHKNKFILGIVFFVLIIAIIIYFSLDFSHKFIFKGNRLFYGDKQILVGFENLKPSDENINYSFSLFVRLNNLDGNTDWGEDPNSKKYIIDNYGTPNVVYYRKSGNLVLEVAYKDNDGIVQYYEFVLEYFPKQKWSHICITVNGHLVNVFKDGEIYTSKKLDSPPMKSQKMLSIGKQNANAYIGLIDYYNRPLSINEVRNLYFKRKKSLPNQVLSYEETKYLDNKKNIRGKVESVKKV